MDYSSGSERDLEGFRDLMVVGMDSLFSFFTVLILVTSACAVVLSYHRRYKDSLSVTGGSAALLALLLLIGLNPVLFAAALSSIPASIGVGFLLDKAACRVRDYNETQQNGGEEVKKKDKVKQANGSDGGGGAAFPLFFTGGFSDAGGGGDGGGGGE